MGQREPVPGACLSSAGRSPIMERAAPGRSGASEAEEVVRYFGSSLDLAPHQLIENSVIVTELF